MFELAYQQSYPYQNPYQLIMCSFSQINPHSYFTISGQGITYAQSLTESTVTPISEWEHERALFLKLRQIKFFKNFIYIKACKIWQQFIRGKRRNNAYNSLTQISLLSHSSYVSTLTLIKEQLAQLFEVIVYRQKAFSFFSLTEFIGKIVYPSYSNISKSMVSEIKQIVTDRPQPPVSLREFVLNFRDDLKSGQKLIDELLTNIVEVVLKQCKLIQQQIQERLMAQSDPSKQQTDALLAVSNAANFNANKMRALVKLTSYVIVETLLRVLVE